MHEKQLRLPLSRQERLQCLESIDYARLADIAGHKVTRRQWARVVDLVTQIELCTGLDGCFAYVETLAARMDCRQGVSARTLRRAAQLAQQMGILAGLPRANRQGQQSNQWLLNWPRIAAIAAGRELPLMKSVDEWIETGVRLAPVRGPHASTRQPNGAKPVTRDTQNVTRAGQTDSAIIRNNPSPNSSPQESRSRRGEELSLESGSVVRALVGTGSWDQETARRFAATELRRLCGRVTAKLGPCRGQQDRRLVIKAVILSKTKLSEDWLWETVERVAHLHRQKPRGNVWAYLHRALETNSRKWFNLRLDRELARVEIPLELEP